MLLFLVHLTTKLTLKTPNKSTPSQLKWIGHKPTGCQLWDNLLSPYVDDIHMLRAGFHWGNGPRKWVHKLTFQMDFAFKHKIDPNLKDWFQNKSIF